MKFRELGFLSLDEYLTHFLNTLLPTNKTYTYFVDWGKVLKDVKKYTVQLHLLNSLRDENKQNIKKAFIKLCKKYPEVISALPILIAERLKKQELLIFDDKLDKIIKFNFDAPTFSDDELQQITNFCEKTGIFDLILSVKDLYDYVLGVEVGMDTNTRKNRSGKIFESIIANMLKKKLKSTDYHIITQDPNVSLYVTQDRGINKHDFVIYKGKKVKAIIEVNFYNTVGSKPEAIVGNYINLSEEAKKRGLEFIWITDGIAWNHMQHYLRKAMEEMDWIMNYNIAKHKITAILK